MPFPAFYDPSKVGTLYIPDVAGAIAAGHSVGIKPASEDSRRTLLVLVDPQVDFIHTDGTLSVPGAIEDTQRTIKWLLTNIEQVTGIVASLDSHIPMQIFYPTWWSNDAGEQPAAFTPITAEDVKKGVWQPTIEPEWSVGYVKKLEEQAKKTLMIWPYHTMIGTPGHTLTPALYEAIAYHAAARSVQPTFYVKGSIPKTEHYSILEPEVKVRGVPLGELNTQLLDTFVTYDLIYVAGQAKSHCVLETVASMMRHFGDNQPETIGKLRLLEDCMSSVAHPEIDFEALANEQLAKFEEQGIKIVRSKDPIG